MATAGFMAGALPSCDERGLITLQEVPFGRAEGMEESPALGLLDVTFEGAETPEEDGGTGIFPFGIDGSGRGAVIAALFCEEVAGSMCNS